MIVKLKCSVVGPALVEVHEGDFAEMRDEGARRYIERGMAEAYDPVKHGQPETVKDLSPPTGPPRAGTVLGRAVDKITRRK
jgi:hypothetical protein